MISGLQDVRLPRPVPHPSGGAALAEELGEETGGVPGGEAGGDGQVVMLRLASVGADGSQFLLQDGSVLQAGGDAHGVRFEEIAGVGYQLAARDRYLAVGQMVRIGSGG